MSDVPERRFALDDVIARLRVWRQSPESNDRRLFTGAVLVGALSVVGMFVGVIRDVVIAARFGASDTLDAFVVASTLALYVTGLLGTTFTAALMPVYIATREQEGIEAADQLFRNALAAAVTLLLAAVLMTVLGGDQVLHLIAPKFSPEKHALTLQLLRWMLPVLVIGGVGSIWTGILNAGEKFILPALGPLVRHTGFVLVLLVWWRTRPTGNQLAMGAVCGVIFEATFLSFGLRRRGISRSPAFTNLHPRLGKVMRAYAPVVLATFFTGLSPIVDQAFASRMAAGDVSVLSYANKLVSVVLATVATSLGTVALPIFSRLHANRDFRALRSTLDTYTRAVLVLGIPVAGFVAILSAPLVRLLFQHGAFTPADASRVASVQAMYALQIPVYALVVLYARVLLATGAFRFLAIMSFVNCAVNVALDAVFSAAIGLPGIALATTVMYGGSALVTYAYIVRRLALLSKTPIEFAGRSAS